MSLKTIVALYQSKNGQTGLTVKAQIYKNGSGVAVGGSAVSLTELDSTNSPGIYVLTQASSALTTLGFAAGDTFEAEIDCPTSGKSAPAPFKEKVTAYSTDDLNTSVADVAATLGTPSGASVSADVASVKSDTSAIKTDLESGANSLATILSNIQSLQNASIGNGVGFVLPSMIIPTTGSNTYTIPITIQDNLGALIDPTSNIVTVGVLNSAGTDRGSYLTGSTGTPLKVAATRNSMGQYTAVVVIPSTELEEELIFSFAYTIGSNAMVRFGVSATVTDLSAAGYALQSTLLSVASDVTAVKDNVENVTTGTVAISNALTDPTSGLAALEAFLSSGTYGLSALQGYLSNGTYGLSALKSAITASALEVTSGVEGSGFSTSTDSLHALSVFLSSNVYYGGRAV